MKGPKSGHRWATFVAACRSQYWREEDARVVLEEWSSSEIGLEEFAKRHGLNERRLRRWSERLGRSIPGRIRFHPVEVRLGGLAGGEAANSDGGVAVVARGGRRVVVGRDFDEELLARVVRVVESWC
jgi:hypothetical protein